jgi:hypothetical protein
MGLWVSERHVNGGMEARPLADVLRRNMAACMEGKETGWEVLFIAPSLEDALEFNRQAKRVIRESRHENRTDDETGVAAGAGDAPVGKPAGG